MKDYLASDWLLLLACLGLIYFIPTIVAFYRQHEYRWVILAMNFVGGFTVVFWIGALLWAVFPANRGAIDPVIHGAGRYGGEPDHAPLMGQSPPAEGGEINLDSLERLHRLKHDGALTEDEFAIQKRRLLRARPATDE